MNDGVLLVNFGSLETAGGNIQAAVNKLTADLDELKARARPLVDTWSGDAQAAYQVRQETWTRAADDLKAILQSIQTAVEDAKVNYHDTEKRATNRFA
jgi:6 kDa early secretory antigenic target